NQVTSDGQPKFFEKDIPTTGDLTAEDNYEPRIYFSQNSPDYSFVTPGSNSELDYPDAKEGTSFKGSGNPKISNPLIRLFYAAKFGDYQMLFSDKVTNNSQVLYNRDPSERVKAVAPYLTLDGRVYPAAVDGKIKWIIDAYTTSDQFPYSSLLNLGTATKDVVTETSNTISGLDSVTANYVRNSVKATVDAYDGSVTLYAWDPEDPVLKAWSKIYGQNLHSISEISGSLMSHIRYPENLFKIQRQLLSQYHVTDANQFFTQEDIWKVPNDPTTTGSVTSKTGSKETGVKQAPYYLTIQMPENDSPIFSLTSAFIPGGGNNREILTGFLSADSDAGDQAGVVGPNYGKLHLLELPKNTTVPGPGQAQNNFNANADVSKELNLLSQGSTSVKKGNLLTLPIGGGLVYIEPVYVQSTGGTSFPLLKKVLVAFGDKVGFADTLEGALDQVFGGDSGAQVDSTAAQSTATNTNNNNSDETSQTSDSTQSSSTSNNDQTSDNSQTSNSSDSANANKLQALRDCVQAFDDGSKTMNDLKACLDSSK
ncbi:MAG: UPF0182 family protein, partial [Candidatus Ancillula sp.]|nr:UPF0182 family protein [Candidatus Ancillula sp.]